MTELNCEQFREKIHPLLDGELTPDEQVKMQRHMDACADCKQEFEQLSAVRDMLSHMDDDLETPLEFERGWRRAVRQESRLRKSRRWVKALSCVAAGLILLAGATAINRYTGNIPGAAAKPDASAQPISVAADDGAGESAANSTAGAKNSSSGSELTLQSTDGSGITNDALAGSASGATNDALAGSASGAANDALAGSASGAANDTASDTAGSGSDAQAAKYSYSSKDNLSATSSGTGGILDVPADSSSDTANTSGTIKVLRSASITIETEKFDDDMAAIKSSVAKFGGLFERNAISGDNGSRNAQLTLRVPAGFLETFVEQIRGIGHVLDSVVSAQDVSNQYSDTALKIDTYRAQLTRVKELTAQAKDLNEVLELEQKASELQYEIDTLTGTLKGWDSQAEMSTVNVTLTEYTHVDAAFSATGFAGQISTQFSDSMSKIKDFFADMTLTAIAILPHLLWAVPVAALIWLGVKAFKKKGFRRRHAD